MDQSASRRHTGNRPLTDVSSRSLPRHSRQAVVALIIGAGTILACALVGYLAYDVNREMIFRRVARENLTIARTVANYINEPPPVGDKAARETSLEQIRAFWTRFDPPTSEAFLCVVTPEGKMVVCTAHTNMEGGMVNDLPLGESSVQGATTIGDLLSTKEDFFGEDATLMGERQLVGFAYSKMLDHGVMVHIPTAQIESEVAAAAWPWSVGIVVVAGLLIPLSLGLLHRSFSSAHRAALCSEAALQKTHSYLKLLKTAAVASNEATDVDSAIQTVLDEVCACTGWTMGAAHVRVSGVSDRAEYKQFWHLDDPEHFEPFRTAMQKIPVEKGIGLSGSVFTTGKPVWVPDIQLVVDELPLGDLAVSLGLRSALFLPVLIGSEVVGLLVFSSLQVEEPDRQFLEAMADVGTQLGRVIERKEAEATLTNVARGYSTSTDDLFFKSLASHLALELDAEYTLIGELCPDDSKRVRTIAVFADGELLENFQYDLKGTPCENVTQQSQCAYKCGIQDQYPEDQLLVDMGVEAYVGTPLNDTNGNAIGLMAVLFRHELEDTRKAETLLRIYAIRAQAELERMCTEVAIQEKEKQLDNLLSNVGVIVMEGDPFNVYYVGGQVERILGYPRELWFEDPDGPVGFWAKHLHPDDLNKLKICRRAIELGEDHVFEYRMMAADGREIWFYDTVTVETENGAPVKTRSVMVDITDRKQAEIELGENEGRIRALLEGAFEGIIIYDKGKIVEANHAFADMYGYTLEEVIGLSPVEMTTPESAQEIARHIASGDEKPYEIVGLKKDGTTFDLEVLGKNCIHRGRIARITAMRDITDRKKLEKASLARIHRAERQQAAITELVTHPTLKGGDLKEAAKVITQLVGNAIDVERTGIWLFSDDRKSIRCENLFELTPNRHSRGMVQNESDYPSYFQALKTTRAIAASDAVADPRTCEFAESYLNPLGITSMLDVAVRVSGEIVGVVCHEHVGELRDWTPDEIAFAGQIADQVALVLSNQERQRARRAQRESEEQVRLLLDSTAEAIYGLDLEGNCTFCNPACLEMLGYDSPDHLMGKNMHELIHHSRNDGSHYPVAECRIYEAIRDDRGTHVDDEVLWKQDGESFDAEYWSFPIRREGRIVGSVVTFLDITERKLNQDRQQLLMAELDHRVKNNLSAVIALAEQTIVTAPSLAAFRESYVGRIQALARIHEALAATKWTGANLSEILRLTLDPYSREDSHRISTRGEDIILDARSCQPITMALHELATNAAKYGSLSTPEGTISIEWRLDPDHQLHFSWIESGGPLIADSPQPGFGSSLIRGVIEHELRGTVGIEYLKEGLSCTMVIPMEPQPPHMDLLEPKITRTVKEQVLP